MNKSTLFIILVATTVLSCKQSAPVSAPVVADGTTPYPTFVASISSFPYSADSNRTKTLKRLYPKLRLGMTKAEVDGLLGKPDYSAYLYSKGPERKFIGTSWTYVFILNDASLVNEKTDKGIQLFFGDQYTLEWAVPKNIEGLKEIGGPRNVGS